MSRTRSTVDINVPQGPYTWIEYNKLGGVRSTLVTNFTHVKDRVITDNITPDYLGKLSRGEFLPINEVVITTTETRCVSPSSGSYSHKNPASLSNTASASFSGSWYALISGATLPSVTISQADIDAVVIKAMASAKEPVWDALTFLGELPETIRYIAKRIRSVNRIARKVAQRAKRKEIRRSKRKKVSYDPKKALEYFTALWLESRYAIRPLVYDVQSMLALLRHKSNAFMQRKSARLTKSVTASAGPSVSDNGIYRYTLTRERVGECRLRAVVFYKGDMSPIGANPVIAGWELTRLSFVADWFVNVGAWIQALSPRVGYDQLGVSVSTVLDYNELTKQVASEGSGHTWNVNVTDINVVKNIKTYHRWSYTGVPLPSIQINLNAFKVVDLISLALQSQKDVLKILRL